MALHSFTLFLKGGSVDDVGTRLHAGGCDDALIGEDDGRPYAAFTRGGASMDDAIAGATADVEMDGIEVVSVDCGED